MYRGLIVKKLFTTFLTLVLTMGVLLSGVQSAFADENTSESALNSIAETAASALPGDDLFSSDSSDLSDLSDLSDSSTTSNDGESAGTDAPESSDAPAPEASDSLLVDGVSSDGDGFELTMLEIAPVAAISPTASIIDELAAIIELGRALNELLDIIRTASGPSIECADSTILSEDNLTASFQEGVYYRQLVTLINRINELLVILGLQGNLYVNSLPISVDGTLPPGFSFSDNTLTLTDESLLDWSEALGDAPDATTRVYQIVLYLSTGSPYIDIWLRASNITNLAAQTFDIELQLTNLPDADDPGGGDGGDDGTGDGSGDHNQGNQSGGGNTGGTGGTGGSTYNNGTTGNSPQATASTSEADSNGSNQNSSLNPASTPNNQNNNGPSADNPVLTPTQTIGEPLIPSASVMLDGFSNLLAANISLVTLSLILSIAALISLRQVSSLKDQRLSDTGVHLNQIGRIVGFVGIGLGALNAMILVVSYYLDSFQQSSTIVWTPVLITIAVIQAACTLALLIIMQMVKRRMDKKYFKIRY